MYRAFNVKLDTSVLNNYEADYTSYNHDMRQSIEQLKQLIASNATVAAEKIKEIILPTKDYDIFLSHSHNDLDLVLRFKKYLEKVFSLTVFVDSVYWENIDDLQEILNKYHLDSNTNLFNHQKTMQVAAHANMILASALTEMIDCCESVFFLNTNNSVIKGRDVVNDDNATYSPWIYHEVYTTTIIKPKPLKRHYKAAFEHRDNAPLNESMPQIEYGLNLDKMGLIDLDKLNRWQRVYLNKKAINKTINSLDILYNLKQYEN